MSLFRFLLVLVAALSPVFASAACVDKQLQICEDSSSWPIREQLMQASGTACGVYFGPNGEGTNCMGWGFDIVIPPPVEPPGGCPAAGTTLAAPGQSLSIRIINAATDPKLGCDSAGCQFQPVDWSTSVRSCDQSGACYAHFPGGRPKYTGGSCDPKGITTDVVDPPSPPIKPNPLDPKIQPIDNPDGIFPGCKNNTDPGCSLEKLPPGCKKTTTTTATGGVNEKTVCEETTCSPSICKKVSTSDDKSWATGGGFKAGDPPDEQTTKTTETLQPRTGSGSGAGGPAGGGTGAGTSGGSSSGVGLSDLNGDGFMDGDTDKDGTCDVNCTKSPDPEKGSYCEENPKSPLCEKKDECDEKSNTLGCMRPGQPGDDKVGKSEVSLGLKASPYSFGGGGGGGSCPAPVVVKIGSTTAKLIDPGPICSVLSSVVRPIVIMIALFSGAFIIFGGIKV